MSSQSNQTMTNSDAPSLVSGSSDTAKWASSQKTPRPSQASPDVLVQGSASQAPSEGAPDQTAATAASSSQIALQSSTPSRPRAADPHSGRTDPGHSRHFNSTPPVVNRQPNTPRNDGQSTHGSHEISPSSPAYWGRSWAEGRQRRDSTPTPNPRER
jgi:hypothetical protein